MQRWWGAAAAICALALGSAVVGEEETEGPGNVSYFSVVKLQHTASSARLHSSQMTYGTGSGQQAITAYPVGGDPNSYWIVKGPHGEKQPAQGAPVECGGTIRLQHVGTTANLHAHNHKSPLTGNIEVSGYGEGDEWGDEYDDFTVECADEADFWLRDQPVYLYHKKMAGYLSSNAAVKFPRTIRDHQEVCLMKKKTANAKWRTNEGVYFVDAATW